MNTGNNDSVTLLIGTRKGAWTLTSDKSRRRWKLYGPHFLGNIVNHFVMDPRDNQTLLLAARTGHLGPTIFRSVDGGRNWQEAARPPMFDKPPRPANSPRAGARRKNEPLANFDPAVEISPRSVDFSCWLAPGHPGEPGVWYAGSSPQGLFRSADAGMTWESVSGFNNHPNWAAWTDDGKDETPDGPMLHSILIDPRDPAHMYVGLSGGGVFESLDQGDNWHPLNKGLRADFMPDPYPEYGQDPHCIQIHPLNPDILYQQNHCGIYRLERPSDRWERIGDNMPRDIGDIGFPVSLHPNDPATLWVFPMDATDVWPRTSPGGKPAVYKSTDSGKTWQRKDNGLPKAQAWFTVLRQSMAVDACDSTGVYFGTTTGEIWGSTNAGDDWKCLASHLPHIYAIEAVNGTVGS